MTKIEPRDVVHVDLDKRRTAVVVRIMDEFAEVVYGQSSVRDGDDHKLVEPHTRSGRALELYKRTFFSTRYVRLVKVALLSRTGRRCPPNLFIDIRELAEKGRLLNLIKPVLPVTERDVKRYALDHQV